jgi:hypothetical protein
MSTAIPGGWLTLSLSVAYFPRTKHTREGTLRRVSDTQDGSHHRIAAPTNGAGQDDDLW